MNVDKFLSIMKKYVGADKRSIPDFCCYIFSLVMKEPETDEELELDKNDEYYPFSKSSSGSSARKLFNGERGIPESVAQMVHAHFDKSGLLRAIESLAYDTKSNLCTDLKAENTDCNVDNVSEVSAELFNSFIRATLNKNKSVGINASGKRNEIGEVMPPVPIVPVRYSEGKVYTSEGIIELSPYLQPDDSDSDNVLPYIEALLEVYSEKEGRVVQYNNVETMKPIFRLHFTEQTKAYYGAESVYHMARETFCNGDEQFIKLKEDTYDGVAMVYFDDCYATGFDRLQAVLKHVTSITLSKSALHNLSGFIGNLEKQGICHILVNDGRFPSWVNFDV